MTRALATLGLLCTVFLGSAYQATKANQSIKIVADEWPPFSGETLPNKGISLDVIATVLERAGYTVETEILPWIRVLEGAAAGDHDIVGSLFQDPDIAQFMTYSEPYFKTEIKFVRQKGGNQDYSDLDSLRPYNIIVGDGFFYEENFDRAEFLNKTRVTTTIQAVKMVAYGRGDLTLDSTHVIEHSIAQDDPELRSKIEFLSKPLAERQIHMAIGNQVENKDQIILDFNRTLNEMKNDGSLDSLLSKHF